MKKTFKEYLSESMAEKIADSTGDELYTQEVVVRFKNAPREGIARFLFESRLQTLEEGKTKDWGSGYTYRLDRRPENQGGDQLHIYGPRGQAWAYRRNGERSEPSKYTLKTTNVIKDIVTDIFCIPRSDIAEAVVISASKETLLLELLFI